MLSNKLKVTTLLY